MNTDKAEKRPENTTVKCICCGSKYITAKPVTQYYCLKCIQEGKNILQSN